MTFTDPFQFSTAGYRLAGIMVENQMRFMLALTDATFGGKNPFFHPPVARREATKPVPAAAKATKPQIARVAKPRIMPEDVKRKAKREPSAPPAMPAREQPMHPAE